MSWRWAGKDLGWLALTTVVLVGMTLVLWWWGMDPVRRENGSVS